MSHLGARNLDLQLSFFARTGAGRSVYLGQIGAICSFQGRHSASTGMAIFFLKVNLAISLFSRTLTKSVTLFFSVKNYILATLKMQCNKTGQLVVN